MITKIKKELIKNPEALLKHTLKLESGLILMRAILLLRNESKGVFMEASCFLCSSKKKIPV